MSAQALEQRARELLAAECGRSVDEMRYDLYGVTNTRVCIRAIVAVLRQQPAPVVDDARMARALEWVQVMAMQDADGSHVPAIQEAIAAYDPNCGARTVRVVDDAMVDAAIAAQDAHWANDDNYPARAPRSAKGDAELHDKLARGAMRAALTAAITRAQGFKS